MPEGNGSWKRNLSLAVLALVAGGGGSTGLNYYFKDANTITRDHVIKWIEHEMEPHNKIDSSTWVLAQANASEIARRESIIEDAAETTKAVIRLEGDVQHLGEEVDELREEMRDGRKEILEAIREGQ